MYHRAWLQRASPSLQLLGPSEMQPPPHLTLEMRKQALPGERTWPRSRRSQRHWGRSPRVPAFGSPHL